MNTNEGQSLSNSQASCEEMEGNSDLDSVSPVGTPRDTSIYTLEELNSFLDETFGRAIKADEYFEDSDTFIRSVAVLKRQVGFNQLDERKRYCLKKHDNLEERWKS